jgi:site-specific recombinase XerD
MSVTLRKRKNGDGSTSLLLDIYHNGQRTYEFLKSLKLSKAANILDRQKNRENMQLAEKIATKRAQELSANDYSIITDTGKNTIVAEWMQTFIDKYDKKDKRNMQGALNRFKDFLIEKKLSGLTFARLTGDLIRTFQDYLRARSIGEGASSYFNRFKKMVKAAYRAKLLQTNPAAEVPTRQGRAKRRDTLTMEEIKRLNDTPTESDQVKRAFLFTCMTGLAWIDVKLLKWKNISEGVMTINRKKLSEEADAVTINLNDAAIKLIGNHGRKDELVFDLPTANGCNKTLKAWVKRAGIKKKITWHNGRHSFGTNLIYLGVDVIVASSLLGHSTLKHTQRYVKAANELKQRATDKINIDL